MTPNEQLDLWLAGTNMHDDERDECCPDFSCCAPSIAWPQEKRELFAKTYREGGDIQPMLNEALAALAAGAFTLREAHRALPPAEDRASIKQLFLDAPDGQLDPHVKRLVKEWDDPPKAIQILRVLDEVVHTASGSGFVVTTLETLMRHEIEREGTTYEHLVEQAHWRKVVH